MTSIFAGNRSRRRGRQAAEGRSRARSILPVAALGICMIAALYGNMVFYADKTQSNTANMSASSASSFPAAEKSVPKDRNYLRGKDNVEKEDAGNEEAPLNLASEEAFPDAPPEKSVDEAEAEKPWSTAEAAGGVQEHWDDDGKKDREEGTLSGWQDVEGQSAPGEKTNTADGDVALKEDGQEGANAPAGEGEKSGEGSEEVKGVAASSSTQEGETVEQEDGRDEVGGVEDGGKAPVKNVDGDGEAGREDEGVVEGSIKTDSPATTGNIEDAADGKITGRKVDSDGEGKAVGGDATRPEGIETEMEEVTRDAAASSSTIARQVNGHGSENHIEENARESENEIREPEQMKEDKDEAKDGSETNEEVVDEGLDSAGASASRSSATEVESPETTTNDKAEAEVRDENGAPKAVQGKLKVKDAIPAERGETTTQVKKPIADENILTEGEGVNGSRPDEGGTNSRLDEGKTGSRPDEEDSGNERRESSPSAYEVEPGDGSGVVANTIVGPLLSVEERVDADVSTPAEVNVVEDGGGGETAEDNKDSAEGNEEAHAEHGNGGEVTVGFPEAKNGATRGTMECSSTKLGEGAESIKNIATWRDVPGDDEYRGPLYQGLAESNVTRYVTLEKDLGGFNNIRLSLECGVAFAAATGRTFVIPPAFPIWNMNEGLSHQEVDLRNLFSFDKLKASGRVSVITTEEFMEKEALPGNLRVMPSEEATQLQPSAVAKYLEQVGQQYPKGLPVLEVEKSAFVMPRRLDDHVDLETEPYKFAKEWLYGRTLIEYREGWQGSKIINWRGHDARLLAPFYAFVLHADEVADRYYKRLMRDKMHYPEEVYCKASQIIALLEQEDPSGRFSSFHVRRNDFLGTYQAVNISPTDVIETSLDHLSPNEVLYIATDEKDLTVFEPFKEKGLQIRFLSDYYERAGVSELDPNLLGMLEQIIASHGRTFTGCWFSTFTAYILRLRGHLEQSRMSNFSYFTPKKTYHHAFHLPGNPLWATEWPLGWEGLDDSGTPDPMAP